MNANAIDNLTKNPVRDGCVELQAKIVSRPARAANLLELAIQSQELCSAFGVADADVATRLLSQLVNILHPDPTTPVEPQTINQALGIIQSIGPKNATEAMTAIMMVASEHAAMDAMRRAAHPAQTPGGRQSYTGLSLKAMRTFAQLLEAFNHGRGKGVTTQQIIVSHVSVQPGAQAIVGAVAGGRG